MFETEDLDYAKYIALLQKEFPRPGAAKAALEKFFPVSLSSGGGGGKTVGLAGDGGQSRDSGGESALSEAEAVDQQLARLSRMMWYDAAKWYIAKTLSRRQRMAKNGATNDQRRCWFYMFDAEAPFSNHCSDATYWNGRLVANELSQQRQLSAKAQVGYVMARALVNFCRTGDPNASPPSTPAAVDRTKTGAVAAASEEGSGNQRREDQGGGRGTGLLSKWPPFGAECDGYMQFGNSPAAHKVAIGVDKSNGSVGSDSTTSSCCYVPLAHATRALYEFMETEYFSVLDERLGLGWTGALEPEPEPAPGPKQASIDNVDQDLEAEPAVGDASLARPS